jgi:hypothetical protein
MAQQSTRDEHLDRPRFFVYGVVGGAHLGRPQACPDHWHRGRTVGPAGSRGGRAAHLLEPGLRETGSHSIRWGVSDYTIINLVSALALIDPQRAVEQVLALPGDPGLGTDIQTTKNLVRMEVAKILARHGADRWRHLSKRFLYLSTPDQTNPQKTQSGAKPL